jgi:hypothetical protein
MGRQRAWHVVNHDGTTTEETEESLHGRVDRGSIARETLVWTFGMPDWAPAGQILADWFTRSRQPESPRPRQERDARSAPGPDIGDQRAELEGSSAVAGKPRSRRGRSYISRHWRGELPLPISYWVNGLLLFAGVIAAETGLAWVDITAAPQLLTGLYAGLGLFAVSASVWQLVGVWRSAGRTREERHRAGKHAVWAGLARVAAGLGFLSLVGNSIHYTLPNVWANLQIALGEDPVPRHVLTVLNGGTEIEVSGGIDFGTASELETLLNAAPAVRVIDLASPGGWVGEAENVRDLIRARRLATYTDADCSSACTVIYMAGYPRYLGPGGKLGFHRYFFPGQTPERDADVNQEGEQDLVREGVSADFAAKVFSTPSERIWKPDRATLLSARVVTQEVDGMAFAAAATAGRPVTREGIEKQLQGITGFAALRRADPTAYAQVIEAMETGIRNGSSLEEVLTEARAPLATAMDRFRKVAEDGIQVRIAAIESEEARTLAADHPDLCLAMLNGSPQKGVGYFAFLPADIQNKGTELTAAIIESGSSRPQDWLITDKDANSEMDRLWMKVQSKGIDISTVGKPPVTVSDERSSCVAMGEFMANVARLPPAAAGALMRYLAR